MILPRVSAILPFSKSPGHTIFATGKFGIVLCEQLTGFASRLSRQFSPHAFTALKSSNGKKELSQCESTGIGSLLPGLQYPRLFFSLFSSRFLWEQANKQFSRMLHPSTSMPVTLNLSFSSSDSSPFQRAVSEIDQTTGARKGHGKSVTLLEKKE